jgi:hypothetical protein
VLFFPSGQRTQALSDSIRNSIDTFSNFFTPSHGSAAPTFTVPPTTAPPVAATAAPVPDRSVAARWTPRIAERYFTPVSEFFLHNLHRLKPEHPNARGLNATEGMVIIQLMSHKRDAKAPWPALGTIADRLGLDVRTIRNTVARLEELGYIRREYSKYGGPSKYHLDGLFAAIERLLDEDAAKPAAETEAA